MDNLQNIILKLYSQTPDTELFVIIDSLLSNDKVRSKYVIKSLENIITNVYTKLLPYYNHGDDTTNLRTYVEIIMLNEGVLHVNKICEFIINNRYLFHINFIDYKYFFYIISLENNNKIYITIDNHDKFIFSNVTEELELIYLNEQPECCATLIM